MPKRLRKPPRDVMMRHAIPIAVIVAGLALFFNQNHFMGRSLRLGLINLAGLAVTAVLALAVLAGATAFARRLGP
ncbi:MAG: hypothetical protein WA215_10850 [Candidatus Cybelea sp.]